MHAVCLSNLRSVKEEEGRGAGVYKKDCPMISASSSSCVRVAIALSAAAARAVFVVSIFLVSGGALSAILVC